ncbi:hypothetical protein C1752_00613 [Acaryochloris thomasi RCC1774]|uniref:DUF998 domain-containing protein n=1 Tax=Acaryochloris thomasi RCC1774 TaxID=1764569 RepID=A0A2W1JNA5_9CYAN|nr:DUF998 domain-containing protein [Acaryochloris thomasi]PZD74769.1 hypothetical protein C1752_00613 [Acaryochloris thomasi RCC1774]
MTLKYEQRQSSKLSLICGCIGLVGCIAAIATDFIGIIVVEKHNPISDTISSLAIEKAAWIQDTGLDLFAAGLIACAIALYAWHLGKTKWKAGTLMLALLGIDVLLIAEHNKYAGREDVSGAAIHIYCVYALGILFTLVPLLLAFGLRKVSRKWFRLSLGTAIAWGILSPIFFFIPTSWDGIYERFLSLIMIGWVAAISVLLFQRGQGVFDVSSK